jgi:ribonuclease HI
MKQVQLITDGACLGNPGPGGWAYIMRFGKHTREMFGLRSLKEPCKVEVVTDSEYLKNGITTWIHGWKRNGWKTAAKKPVVNQDLWMQLEQATDGHEIHWTWTKGHANHEDNNRCDELATSAARNQK